MLSVKIEFYWFDWYSAVQQQFFYTKECSSVKCFQAIGKSLKKRKCDLHEISFVLPKAFQRRQRT